MSSARDAVDAEIAARGGDAIVVERARREEKAFSCKPLDLRALAQQKAPPREWLNYLWMPRKGSTVVAGGGGIGKSLLVQQSATAQSLELDFIGRAAHQPRVMVWNCEDDEDELWRRQEAISEYFGVRLEAAADRLSLVSRVGFDSTLMAPIMRTGVLGRTNLFDELREQINDEAIDVVYLDNAAHVYAGDPNDRNQVTTFINALMGLVVERPFAVVIVTHTARAEGSEYAGSAAWENACRARWYFGTKLPDSKDLEDEGASKAVRYLARRKSNYSALDHMRMTYRDGVFVPDAVPDRISGLAAVFDEQRAEDIVVAGFRSLGLQGIAPTDGKTSPDYLPRQIAAKGLSCGYGVSELTRAMNRLMTRGTFKRGVVGTYSNRSPKLGLILNGEVQS